MPFSCPQRSHAVQPSGRLCSASPQHSGVCVCVCVMNTCMVALQAMFSTTRAVKRFVRLASLVKNLPCQIRGGFYITALACRLTFIKQDCGPLPAGSSRQPLQADGGERLACRA